MKSSESTAKKQQGLSHRMSKGRVGCGKLAIREASHIGDSSEAVSSRGKKPQCCVSYRRSTGDLIRATDRYLGGLRGTRHVDQSRLPYLSCSFKQLMTSHFVSHSEKTSSSLTSILAPFAHAHVARYSGELRQLSSLHPPLVDQRRCARCAKPRALNAQNLTLLDMVVASHSKCCTT